MNKLDKELEDVLAQNQVRVVKAWSKDDVVYTEDKTPEAISQIKTVILEALKAEWPKDEIVFKTPATTPTEKLQAIVRNQTKDDCFEVCNKLLGDSNAE